MAFTLNTDGGSRGNPGPAGCGFDLREDGSTVLSGGWYLGEATNNHAEYSALVWGLQNALAHGVSELSVRADSELMVKQMNGEYRVKSPELKKLHDEAADLFARFARIDISHVYRSDNVQADRMANEAMDAQGPAGSYDVAFGQFAQGACGEESLFGIAAGGDDGAATSPGDDAADAPDAPATLRRERPLVLLGVTGCIAAYKACEIVRGLQRAGVDVKVVMTEHGTHFVGPTTFRSLTGHEVAVGLFDDPSDPIHHISLAKEADLFCIAPATANVVAKIARGVADDLLTTTALATKAPLLIAPAMNTGMWTDQATQDNIRMCTERGYRVIEPGSGYLACGDEGAGRLEDPAVIVERILAELDRTRDLAGRSIVITAGPTREPLDPIRYISNRSSGLTGYLLAEEAAARGARVTLVSGPTSLAAPDSVEVVGVETAHEMLEAARAPFADADAAVFVAAVSDWRPAEVAGTKIKHDGGDLEVRLVPNPDIAATLGAEKGGTYVVCFAAETGDPVEAARGKLVKKNADLVVANNVAEPGVGMGAVDNHVWLVDADGVEEIPTTSKRVIVRRLLDRVSAALGR